MSPQEYAKPELLEHVALAAGQAPCYAFPG
jgi:hypothetical protein